MTLSDEVTLIWAERAIRPTSADWSGKQADRWTSLGDAIRFATAMRAERAMQNLHPWIWTPSGHVYSPETIEVMGETFERNRLRGRSAAEQNGSASRPEPIVHMRVLRTRLADATGGSRSR